MMLDRRRAERDRRLSRRVPAVFAVMNTAGAQVQLGQAEDIGLTGMALRWPKDAEFASPVTLTFQLPGTREPIAACAQVVNDRSTGRYRRTGVRFTTLEPQDAALIARYCASRKI
ncbi:MAG TPA: PilZ domain-containing protein [Polyangia bacterium]|nr:PilZ domain-containing protein [Polyangia bacterium]